MKEIVVRFEHDETLTYLTRRAKELSTGRFCSFETGYHEICDTIQLEKYRYLA